MDRKMCAVDVLKRLISNVNGTGRFGFGGEGLNARRIHCLSAIPRAQHNFKQSKQSHASNGSLNINPNSRLYCKIVNDNAKSVMNFYEFSEIEDKNERTFNEMISLYEERFKTRKGVVDFIFAALKHMKEFGVHEDLKTYKRLIDLMPKGKMVPTNRFQLEMQYFPREQDCVLEVLCQMEEHGVIPDVEMKDILSNTFGHIGIPTRKYYRMMYWMPKFKNINPWPVPRPLPKDIFTIAKLAIERITSVDLQTKITVFRTEDVEESIDKTWVISGQSPTQKALLKKHNPEKPIIVEGGDSVWIRKERINYFVLKSEDVPDVDEPPAYSANDISDLDTRYMNLEYKEEEKPTVHEQDDGIIYAICATGTSTKDSLLSWVRSVRIVSDGEPIELRRHTLDLLDLPMIQEWNPPSPFFRVEFEGNRLEVDMRNCTITSDVYKSSWDGYTLKTAMEMFQFFLSHFLKHYHRHR